MATFDITKLAKYMADKQKSLDRVVFQAIYELSGDIIQRTPVMEGFARGSWTIGINKEPISYNNEEDTNGQSTIRKMGADLKRFRMGDTVYFGSNLEYMSVLEFGQYGTGSGATSKTTRDGYSLQAPNGMVRVSIDNMQRNVDRAVKDEQ